MSYEKNQASIQRQSSLKFVGDYCKTVDIHFTLKEIVAITNVIVDYTENGYSKELGTRLDRIDDAIKSKIEEMV
jgi:hypothetical protein